MNSTLTIGSLSGTLVSDDERTVTSAQETTFEKEAAPTRDAILLERSSLRSEELLERILTILIAIYLVGAIGLGAILLSYSSQY